MTMLVKPSAPYLLLAVLAVLSGRTEGEMHCNQAVGAFLLADNATNWNPQSNAKFDGYLDGYIKTGYVGYNGAVSMRSSVGCMQP